MREDAEIVVNVSYTNFGTRIAEVFADNAFAYVMVQRDSDGMWRFEEERLSWRIQPGDLEFFRECALRGFDNSEEQCVESRLDIMSEFCQHRQNVEFCVPLV